MAYKIVRRGVFLTLILMPTCICLGRIFHITLQGNESVKDSTCNTVIVAEGLLVKLH